MDEELQRAPIGSSALSVILTIDGRPGWEDALAGWATYLNGLDRDYELLLAAEEPGIAVDAVAAHYARGRALPGTGPSGFGAALQRGLASVQHPLVLYTRCDGHYKPAELQALLKMIDRVDVVAGRRVFPRGVARRRGQVLAYWLLNRCLFATRLHDLGCLLLLARRAIFARIPVQSAGVFAHAEVIAKANFLGCLLQEATVAYQPLPGDEPDPALREVRADMRQVFFHPDFGPPEVHLDLKAGVPAAPG